MGEREELEQAMVALEKQRAVLGDAAVEAALTGLRQKLAALDGHQPVSPEQQITRFMPKALADKMRMTRHIEGERRQVTVLFADLSGYTPLSERLDPEVVMSLSQDLLKELAEAVYQHEGYVAQFMGDAVMAVFGAPLTHEDDPVRAIHAAFAMCERSEILNRRWRERLGQPLALHIGLNTGTAVTGSVGADLRLDYAVIGDTTNTAQRLQSTAQRGEILVSHETYRLTRDVFTFEELEPIVMKGKREPVSAYRVLGVKSKFSRGRGLERRGLASPLVGRAREIEFIEACLERLYARGQGAIMGIIGEAGLGKSRLVAEAKAFAVANNSNVLWLEGQTLSFGQTISYWPFQQIVRQWANIAEDDDSDASWSKLEQQMRALFGEETIDYLPYLASLVALQVQGEYAERVKYLDGDAMGKQIFLTSRRFFERLARTQPTVLVFEDLHWMDESSTLLLEHLFPLAEMVPLVIFGLSRPERDTPAARLRELCARDFANYYTEIRLIPLSDADSAQLINNLLEIENMPPRLREMIVDKADGNPFFLEEVIRTLLDRGAVVRDAASGRWRATAQIESIHIPNTIQGVIMARVDRLDEELKQVLRLASVIGRSFLYRVLKAIAEAEQRLDEDLNELQATDLIREKQHLPELEFMFKHALAQEATYESILLQKRRELHARVAPVIESLFGERLEEFYGLLAYHYAQAETWDKAQQYLLKAADHAGQMAADAEALNLYEQAMTAYARAFGDRWDPAQQASLERKMGQALFRRGEPMQALQHLNRALEYLGTPLPRSQGKIRRAIVLELLTQVAHRLLPRFFVRYGLAQTSTQLEEANVFEDLGYILSYSNLESFFLNVVRALNIAERRGNTYAIIEGSTGLGIILAAIPAFGIAEDYFRRSISLAKQISQPNTQAIAHFGMAVLQVCLGKLDLALQYGARSVAAYQEVGNLHGWGTVAFLMASIHVYRGELGEAFKQGASLVRFGQDGGDLQLECWGEVVQGFVDKRFGHLQEAHAHLDRAIQLSGIIRDNYAGLLASGELGRCSLRQQDLPQALAAWQAGERIGREYRGLGDAYTPIRHGQAEMCLLQVERASEADRAEWLRKANRACQSAFTRVKRFHPGAPEAMLLKGRYEWLRGKPEGARKWWNKSLAEATRMGMRYDEGMTHFEIGQRLGERAHLEKAETIFAEIGAEWDLAKARELLGH